MNLRKYMLILAMILLLVPAEGPCLMKASGGAASKDECPISKEIENWAAEFRRLRAMRGHFEGEDWKPEVDRWMGRKHRVMVELGSFLGSGGCRRATIFQLLGPPDRIASEGQALFEAIVRSPGFQRPPDGPHELLIYYWRGIHDFLYFISRGETIFNSGWWHAGE